MNNTITKYELASSWLQDQAEALGAESMKDYYESLLLTGKQSAIQLATQQYQTAAQSAGERASYDISKAYANYLKQQRGIAAQSNLEKGYKEEVGEALQQQYRSAYNQAKTTQTSALASAATKASETYYDTQTSVSNMVSQVAEQYTKRAQTYANLFKASEEFALSKGADTINEWYALNPETNITEITPWGREQFRSALLQYGGEFKSYLEDEGLTDEMSLYLSNPTAINEELFGFTETDYGITEASRNQIFLDKLSGYNENHLERSYNELHEQLESENKTVTDFYTATMELAGLEDKEYDVKKALLKEAGKNYSKDKIDSMSLEDALSENWKWRGETGQPTKDIMMKHYYKWLIDYAQKYYKVKE